SVGLCYFGGQLVYIDKNPAALPQFQAGARLYRVNCSSCHPCFGNIADPTAPVARSPELIDLKTFIHWIRDPRLDNGAKGIMPAFPSSKISDEQAKELRLYILNATGSDEEAEGLEKD
ncbi:MAG: c-type cytochrome, partial [Syntrophorhabdaceae bacterium]